MSRSHYLDIVIKRADVGRELHARLLMALHLQSPQQSNLAVTWPDWGTWGGEFGLIFRVFGEPQALLDFKARIEPLIQHQLVLALAINPVPAFEHLVMFKRDRRFENTSPCHVRRLKRRAEQRGETLELEPKTQKCEHWIEMQSLSTRSAFRFGIKRTAADSAQAQDTVDSYGLGAALPAF